MDRWTRISFEAHGKRCRNAVESGVEGMKHPPTISTQQNCSGGDFAIWYYGPIPVKLVTDV
jgi:hypothetical protein